MSRNKFNMPFGELIRYAFFGVTLNITGYLAYLLFTYYLISPIIAMSFLYPLSVLLGYFTHRRYTFRKKTKGLHGVVLIRYVLVYFGGYLINLALLYFMNGILGHSHEFVQLFSIVVVAGFLFVAMKLYVFNIKQKAIHTVL